MKKCRFHVSHPRRRALYSSIGASCAALILLTGCGGSNSRSLMQRPSVSGVAQGATGRAKLFIKWPARSSSRLIPVAANSIRVDIVHNGQVYTSQVVRRPADTSVPTPVTFDSLPVDTLTVRASAYPTTDGSGVAQAAGQAPLVVQLNQITDFGTITMASTISSLVMTQTRKKLVRGEMTSFFAAAKDSSGSLVLTPQTITWSSSDRSVAAVDRNGVVTGIGKGTATITATETESGVSTTFDIPVTIAAVAISMASPLSSSIPSPLGLAAADFDGDGKADFTVSSNQTLLVFYGLGNGGFKSPKQLHLDNINPIPCVGADINNDGKTDLIFRDDKLFIGVVYNGQSGLYTGPGIIAYYESVHSAPVAVSVGDFNGDGWMDVAAACTGANGNEQINISINDATISENVSEFHYTDGTIFKGIAGSPTGITVGDLNNDGKADCATTFASSDGTSFVNVFGDAAKLVTLGNTVRTGTSSLLGSVTGDFNQDGLTDIAVTSPADNAVTVYLGSGGGAFQKSNAYPAGSAPSLIRSVDFDYDGWPDLVVTNPNAGTFTILRNQRDGSFGSPMTLPTGGDNPTALDVADFNNDTKPDLIFTNSGSGSVTVLLNTSQ